MLRFIIILSTVLLFSCKSKDSLEQASSMQNSSNQWISIFNGVDLEGWTPKIKGYPLNENFGNTFRVEEGILKIRYDEYGNNFNNRFGAIYFDKKLSNYRLKLEYRFVGETAPGAPSWGYKDSGVQFHSQSPASMGIDQGFPVCIEYNLHGGNGTDERPGGQINTNGMYVEINGKLSKSNSNPPTVKKTFHGNQWVALELDVKDGIISHYANGEKILSYSNPVLNPEHKLGSTQIKDGKVEVSEGYISFQSNSHPIDFRKIELMEY